MFPVYPSLMKTAGTPVEKKSQNPNHRGTRD
jgi:hypothetical protein